MERAPYKDAKFNSTKKIFRKISRKIQNFVIRSLPRHVIWFEWNYGGVYSSTRAIALGTFPLPVGTLKPEVDYFAIKPTIFWYQILLWVIKKWFRVDWVTFQYRWNRKLAILPWNRLYFGIKFYRGSSKSDFESIGSPSDIVETGNTGENRKLL